MKKLISLLAVLALVPFIQTSFAVEHPAPEPKQKMKMEQGMGGGQMDHQNMMTHLKLEQDHLLKIHDLSNKILSETDPEKQQELKDQQLKLMEEHHMHKMKTMQNPKMKE